VREQRSLGSVEGVFSNGHSYSDYEDVWAIGVKYSTVPPNQIRFPMTILALPEHLRCWISLLDLVLGTYVLIRQND